MDDKPYRQPSFYMIEDKREELESREQDNPENYSLVEKIVEDYEGLLKEVWK